VAGANALRRRETCERRVFGHAATGEDVALRIGALRIVLLAISLLHEANNCALACGGCAVASDVPLRGTDLRSAATRSRRGIRVRRTTQALTWPRASTCPTSCLCHLPDSRRLCRRAKQRHAVRCSAKLDSPSCRRDVAFVPPPTAEVSRAQATARIAERAASRSVRPPTPHRLPALDALRKMGTAVAGLVHTPKSEPRSACDHSCLL
jgi:hypothetical protein